MIEDNIECVESSGNVFADLDLADAGELLLKAELARTIMTIIGKRRLTQAHAAVLLGVDQPKISALAHGRLSGFSIDRLLRFLIALHRDVEIVVKPVTGSRGSGRFSVIEV